MTYTPINWETGDIITAEKLNKMDNGWNIDETQLFNETVTTITTEFGSMGQLAFVASEIPPETLQIMFDGVNYNCSRQDGESYYFYGAQEPGDFSTYPFALVISESSTSIYTQSPGTYTVAAVGLSTEVSSEFSTAVNACVDVDNLMLCVSDVTTFNEMVRASYDGRLMYFKPYGNEATNINIITYFTTDSVLFIPENTQITATFVDDVFTVQITSQ